ncbi:MAG TPA: ABC transporter permease [Pilimelia sp.]|nr:ABC transporter permease [Pilimelia sp.]
MSTAAATWLVARREMRVRLRSKAFVLGTLVFLLFAAVGAALPALLSDAPADTVVAAAPGAPTAALRDVGYTLTQVPDRAAAEELLRRAEADAAVVPDGGPTGVRVLALRAPAADVADAYTMRPPTDVLASPADEGSPVLVAVAASALALLFFFTVMTYGTAIAQSVVEEKQTRIVEILVAAVPVRALVGGKLVGMTLLALGQIALIALAGLGTVAATGDGAAGAWLGVLGPAVGWFLVFFVAGFVVVAAAWVVAGALVSRVEDLNSTAMPISLVLMVPLFLVMALFDDPDALTVLSYVPLSSPLAMPVRMLHGGVPVWQPLLALLLLVAAAVLAVQLAARLYAGGLLRVRGRTSLRTAWRGDR